MRRRDPAVRSTLVPPRLSPDSTKAISGTRQAFGFGRYRLFGRLGSGGMADVYLAVAQGAMNVNRLVVIKRLRDEHANDPSIREMFLDEARLAARLNHPNVIQTFEADTEAGSFFLAMEYVDGQPLSRLLTALKRAGRTLEPRLAARIVADALKGLHYAHELTDFDGTALGIVHRDVSPQNVMLTYEGGVKLVDFGIAKAVGTAQTAHGVFKGKVSFMAPEQVRCEDVDRRTDIFAAGIVLWECVTGKPLMSDTTPAGTIYNVISRRIPRASEENPNVPPDLDEVIDRALQREPSLRYPTAKEMHEALEAFVTASGGVTSAELGELTATLFAETRAKIQAQVKSQLATLSLARTSESGRHQTLVGASQSQVKSLPFGLTDLEDNLVETVASASLFRVVTGSNERATPLRRLAIVAWFAIATLGLLAGGIAFVRSQSRPAAAPATAPASPPSSSSLAPLPPPTPSPAPSAAPAAATVAASSAPSPSASPAPSPAPPPAPAPHPVFVPRAPVYVAPRAPAPPPVTAAPTPPPPPSEPPRTAPPAPVARPQEVPTGRNFRRDL